jgi:hypothetical protein
MGFKLINLTMYFTNITFAFNCFPITFFINTVLYLCNISAFLGTLILLTINPMFPYLEFKHVFPAPLWLFNLILIAVHFVPLYAFRERQTLRETFAPSVIAATGMAFLTYYLLFQHRIKQFYGLEPETQGKLSLCLFLLYWVAYVILFFD